MTDRNERDLISRLRDLEHRIDELSEKIENMADLYLDEDLKARGLK